MTYLLKIIIGHIIPVLKNTKYEKQPVLVPHLLEFGIQRFAIFKRCAV